MVGGGSAWLASLIASIVSTSGGGDVPPWLKVTNQYGVAGIVAACSALLVLRQRAESRAQEALLRQELAVERQRAETVRQESQAKIDAALKAERAELRRIYEERIKAGDGHSLRFEEAVTDNTTTLKDVSHGLERLHDSQQVAAARLGEVLGELRRRT